MTEKMKLSREERTIEKALLKGEYTDVPRKEFHEIVKAIARKTKSRRVKL